jgi:hypothetical protein
MGEVKAQIVLSGGVMASMAMSPTTFNALLSNKTNKSGVFNVTQDIKHVAANKTVMHAVFCCGWWDNPAASEDGYWICKNRSGVGFKALWDTMCDTVWYAVKGW